MLGGIFTTICDDFMSFQWMTLSLFPWFSGITNRIAASLQLIGIEDICYACVNETTLHVQPHVCKQVHDDVIKWKFFSRNWPFCAGNSPVPVNSPHKGQWRRALMFSLICVWINGWVNNREAGDLRRHHSHYDASVMRTQFKMGLAEMERYMDMIND